MGTNKSISLGNAIVKNPGTTLVLKGCGYQIMGVERDGVSRRLKPGQAADPENEI